jgi:hypothetical protein
MNTLHSILNYVKAPYRACRNARKKPVMIATSFVIFSKALAPRILRRPIIDLYILKPHMASEQRPWDVPRARLTRAVIKRLVHLLWAFWKVHRFYGVTQSFP